MLKEAVARKNAGGLFPRMDSWAIAGAMIATLNLEYADDPVQLTAEMKYP